MKRLIFVCRIVGLLGFLAFGATLAEAQRTTPYGAGAKFWASDSHRNQLFGMAVAMDGDTVVVGSFDDEKADLAGAVYVYQRSATGWDTVNELAKLTASDAAIGHQFGTSVAIQGDTIVVGTLNSRKAYVFVKPAGGWTSMTETAVLTSSDGHVGDQFGASVAIDGDVVVVGAGRHNGDASAAGAAYVFVKPSAGWVSATQTARLRGDSEQNARFGNAVAMQGDTIVVGAEFATGAAATSGAVWIFEKPTTGWVDAASTVKLTGAAGDAYNRFGNAVALDADTVVVAETQVDDVGASHVFVKPLTGWVNASPTATLTASNAAFRSRVGAAVKVQGDLIVVGAPQDVINVRGEGAVYLFRKPTAGWQDMTETAKLVAPDGGDDDQFGNGVALLGDTLIVTGIRVEINSVDAGAAYAFSASILSEVGPKRIGQRLRLVLSAELAEGQLYQVATSLDTTPHLINGRQVGLAQDAVWLVSVLGINPNVFRDYAGTIDAGGQASAAIDIPDLPAIVGLAVHSAFVTFDPQAGSVFGISDTTSFTIAQ